MKRKRGHPEPSLIVKDFTVEEIEQGIKKLQRRIADVRTLDPQQIRYDDAAVGVVERNIQNSIVEIYGVASPECLAHRFHQIQHGDIQNRTLQQTFAAGIPATITMLQGLISALEEKREDLGFDPAARARSTFEGMDLHPRIAEVCADLYRDGHYAQAVFDASKALINYVKERSRRHDLDGAGLMTTVFSVKKPVLAFNDLSDQSDRDEQEGMMHLYIGAVLAVRNPRGHSFPGDSPRRAFEYVVMLSMLASRLEEAKRQP